MAGKKTRATVSRQQRWALGKKATGRCTRCGNKRNNYKWLCDHCMGKTTVYMKRWRLAQKKAAEAKARVLK